MLVYNVEYRCNNIVFELGFCTFSGIYSKQSVKLAKTCTLCLKGGNKIIQGERTTSTFSKISHVIFRKKIG